MMHRVYKITILTVMLFGYLCATFAQDTVFNRVVTVERDYQPEVEEAQAISTTPTFIQYTPKLNPVVYSTYSEPLSIGYNLPTLPASENRFTSPSPFNGIVEGAFGHRNTHFLFGYRLQKNNTSLDLYANHDAYWGRDALSQSVVGLQFTHHFRGADFYLGVEADNDAYAYRPTFDWRVLCTGDAYIGIKSTNHHPFQYRIQTGYTAFVAADRALEHHVKSHIDLWWSNQRHSSGVKAYVQNTLYSIFDLQRTVSPRHAMRFEPFYEYKDKHIYLHAGVNLDMNIGAGELLSTVDNLSFAPSPNVRFEWHTTNNLFHVYANAMGTYGLSSLEEYLGYNRYLNVEQGLTWQYPRAYTPVDAQLGFKLRPIKTLLIDIYGGYAYLYNAYNMEAVLDENGHLTEYILWLKNYQRWKVGASVHYHYRDIVELNVAGNYYFYQQDPIPSMNPNNPYFQENRIKGTTIFDRPNWDLTARIDVHIDSNWSIYSDNYFAGSRWAYTSLGKAQLRPIIALNIGCRYTVNKRLSAYVQLEDYLHRKNDIFYGYQSQGCHFLAGVKYLF